MARRQSIQQKISWTVFAWLIGLIIFFPIFWTILTSFKSEAEAIASPPSLFFFDWTLENYTTVQARSDYGRHFMNSVILSVGSTLIGLLIAIPSAWAMAFIPSKHTKGLLMWMLSTKMMPAVAVLMPIYFIVQSMGLLDSKIALLTILMLMNLPIIIWMLYTYFKEIPKDILEAARMDGTEYYFVLERSVLDTDINVGGCRSADRLYCQLLQSRRFVLC